MYIFLHSLRSLCRIINIFFIGTKCNSLTQQFIRISTTIDTCAKCFDSIESSSGPQRLQIQLLQGGQVHCGIPNAYKIVFNIFFIGTKCNSLTQQFIDISTTIDTWATCFDSIESSSGPQRLQIQLLQGGQVHCGIPNAYTIVFNIFFAVHNVCRPL